MEEILEVFDLQPEEAQKLSDGPEQTLENLGSWNAYSGSANYIECKEY